jgi:hypothetical protein
MVEKFSLSVFTFVDGSLERFEHLSEHVEIARPNNADDARDREGDLGADEVPEITPERGARYYDRRREYKWRELSLTLVPADR